MTMEVAMGGSTETSVKQILSAWLVLALVVLAALAASFV